MIRTNFFNTIRHIGNSSETLAASKLFSLSDITVEELEEFKKIIPQISTQRRIRLMRTLVEVAESDLLVNFEPIFVYALADEEASVRSAALEGLWSSENELIAAPVIHLLHNDPDSGVRALAAQALAQFVYLGEIEEINPTILSLVEEALLQAYNNPQEDMGVHRRALEALSFSGDETVDVLIENAYHHPEEEMRISAVFAMGRNADGRWRTYVCQELDNSNPAMRYEAARACGELELSQALPRLFELIDNDEDAEVQQAAIEALGKIGGTSAQGKLQAIYEGSNDILSEAAADALDEISIWQSATDLPLFDEDFELEDDE
jgi:HEAT repeat protein